MAQVTKAEATAAKQLRSPLLRLLAELRNLIYHYALGNCTFILAADYERLCLYQRDTPAIPLLAVCTQIHAEAALLPYSLNTFDIASDYTLRVFLATMPMKYVQAIKTLHIGTWTVAGKEMACAADLQHFTGLEKVVFCYEGGTDTISKCMFEIAWKKVVELLREKMPEVSTSMRDLRDKAHRREDALELAMWVRRNAYLAFLSFER